MNTSGKNAPATVISIVLLVAALLIATLSRGAGLFLSYLLPGVLILVAALTPISLLMAKQWEKAVSERRIADQQLKEEIGRKTADWGVAAISVEIRDVAIPSQLQDAMSRQAQAEREKAARVILSSAEQEIAQKFLEAANIYARNPAALQLRAMNIIYETTKERGATILMPSAMVDCMNPGGIVGLACAAAGPASPALST
jgi:hypothetical protein